jgi:hypothetical protein
MTDVNRHHGRNGYFSCLRTSDGEEGLKPRRWAGIRAAYLVILNFPSSRHPSDMSREAYDLIVPARRAGFQPEDTL